VPCRRLEGREGLEGLERQDRPRRDKRRRRDKVKQLDAGSSKAAEADARALLAKLHPPKGKK